MMQAPSCLKPLKVSILFLVVACAASFSHAIDNPDAPDYVAAFQQRAQPFQSALEQQDGTAAIAQAQDAYSQFLDHELNLAYQQLMQQLDATPRQKLKVSQRAWLAYYRAETDFIATNWTNRNFGSSSALSRAEYRASLVSTRIVELLHYLKNYPAPTAQPRPAR